MIDIFALAISHGAMALIVILLLGRQDLDQDPPATSEPDPTAPRAPLARKAPLAGRSPGKVADDA